MNRIIGMVIAGAAIIGLGWLGVGLYQKLPPKDEVLKESHEMVLPSNQRLDVIVYTTATCPFCHKAKALLDEKQIRYVEKDLTEAVNQKDLRDKLPNVRTVPQIFIGEEHIGGYSELKEHADAGTLLQKVS